MMKKKMMAMSRTTGGMPVVPQGYKNGGKVKPLAGRESKAEEMAEAKMADGGLMRSNTSFAANVCDYTGGPGVRSQQDYKK